MSKRGTPPRKDKVRDVRRKIAAGGYDTDRRALEATVDAFMLAEVTRRHSNELLRWFESGLSGG